MISIIESYAQYIPDAFKNIVILLFSFIFFIFLLFLLLTLKKFATNIRVYLYDKSTKQYIAIRDNFIRHLIYDIERLNRERNWNDFYYAELEAEIELELYPQFDQIGLKSLPKFISIATTNLKIALGLFNAVKIEKSLIRAIRSSNSRTFLVIGDPGSGKTVSLRRLAKDLAYESLAAKRKNATIPIYINLKHLNINVNKISIDTIHGWIIEQLTVGQDRTICELIDKNFGNMLRVGEFFFLFDSFDEIPAIINIQEDRTIIERYANAIEGFLRSNPKCRGLISSRPYMAPRTFIGQRIYIRPLSDRRIKKIIFKYLFFDSKLMGRLWYEISQDRQNLFSMIRNPFYLGLLLEYIKAHHALPDRHYDLLDHLIKSRTNADSGYLNQLGLTPNELIHRASILAFCMLKSNHVGLTIRKQSIIYIIRNYATWTPSEIGLLIEALCFTRLGRIAIEDESFSFIHRRFHEYLCALYILKNPQLIPLKDIINDERWHEILVLLCEVLPAASLNEIFDNIRQNLFINIEFDLSLENKKRIFKVFDLLQEGFKSRIDDLPNDIRSRCSEIINELINNGDLIDKKHAIEAINIVDKITAQSMLESILLVNSVWLREIAIKSCLILQSIPESIANSIRRHLYYQYSKMNIIQDYTFYSSIFSFSKIFRSLMWYLRILWLLTFLQIVFYSFIIIFSSINDIKLLVLFPICIIAIAVLYKPIFYEKVKNYIKPIFLIVVFLDNRWNSLSLTMIPIVYLVFILGGYNITMTCWLMFILIFLLIFNSYLIGIQYYYPSHPKDWILLPFVLINMRIKSVDDFINLSISVIYQIIHIFRNWGVIFAMFYWSDIASTLAKAQGFSIDKMYIAYGPIKTFLIFIEFILILIFILTIVLLILYIFYTGIMQILDLFIDQIRLRFIKETNNKPKTIKDAIESLKMFKSDWGKANYIRTLIGLSPSIEDLHILLIEAENYQGNVRDEIYKLVDRFNSIF